jgi:ribosomal protein S18 acetylase RimI-like enzyme
MKPPRGRGDVMSNTLEVRFRPSRPEDAAASAPLVHSSGPSSFNYVFTTATRDAHSFLRYALALPEGEFGCNTHVVGTLGGRVVACGAGWPGGAGFRFLRATAMPFIRYMGLATLAAYRHGMQATSIMPEPKPGEFYIGHLGVDPLLRGHGIGEALIAHLLALGRQAGARTAVLDVSVENPRAQALYERMGFRVTGTRQSSYSNAFGRIPGHHRMDRAFDP